MNPPASISDRDAAKEHARTEGDNGNAEISFLAGLAHRDKQIEGLVNALKFYSQRGNWKWTAGDEISDHYEEIRSDADCGDGSKYFAGRRAREALSQFESRK